MLLCVGIFCHYWDFHKYISSMKMNIVACVQTLRNLYYYSVWRMASSGMLHHLALVRTDVSEEFGASFIRVTRIGELGTLAVTSNWRTLQRSTVFLQEPHGITSQKTSFFIVTAVETSNLTKSSHIYKLHWRYNTLPTLPLTRNPYCHYTF
jgi:hypothetical protein